MYNRETVFVMLDKNSYKPRGFVLTKVIDKTVLFFYKIPLKYEPFIWKNVLRINGEIAFDYNTFIDEYEFAKYEEMKCC